MIAIHNQGISKYIKVYHLNWILPCSQCNLIVLPEVTDPKPSAQPQGGRVGALFVGAISAVLGLLLGSAAPWPCAVGT